MRYERGLFFSPDDGSGAGESPLLTRAAGWVETLPERLNGLSRKTVLVMLDTPRNVYISDLPVLPNDKRKWPIRYDPFFGTFYPTRWRDLEIGEEEERRFLVRPEGADWLIKRPDPRYLPDDYLDNLPKDKTGVAGLELYPLYNLESAIRQSSHVIEKMAGEETKQALGLMQKAEELMLDFMSKEMTDEVIEGLSAETEKFLKDYQLLNPKSQLKIEAVEKLRRAPEKDSLDRDNYLARMSRAISGKLKARRRWLVINKLMIPKYQENLTIFEEEREATRWALLQSLQSLQIIRGHTGFRTGEFQSELQQEQIVKKLEETVDNYLAMVRLSPYRQSAFAAEAILVEVEEEEEEMAAIIMADPKLMEIVQTGETVVDLVRQNRFGEAGERLDLARKIVVAALKRNMAIWQEGVK